MPVKKRPRSYDTTFDLPTRKRRYQYSDIFESQDIWKNLDRIRAFHKNAEILIKNSCIFIDISPKADLDDIKLCLKKLNKFVSSKELQFHKSKDETFSSFITLQNFNILDCCLVLPILFALKSKASLRPLNRDFFKIPIDIPIGGTVYIHRNCKTEILRTQTQNTDIKFNVSEISQISNFKELHMNLPANKSLTHFMNAIVSFFSNAKFGKRADNISKRFAVALKGNEKRLKFGLSETSFIANGNGLFDMNLLMKSNIPIIETSEKNIANFVNTLKEYDNPTKPATLNTTVDRDLSKQNIKTVDSQTQRTQTAAQYQAQQQQRLQTDKQQATTSRYGTATSTINLSTTQESRLRHPADGTQQLSERPNFMTQEQIKEHCLATLKAAESYVKSKSLYQILKLYIKCPRRDYIDQVYQNLNDLRSTTNCNIVVLNLNNLHESDTWFSTLDVSKFTSFVQQPHQSTVRVVSIGGVGEYILKALEAISKIMEA
ncbi:Snu56p NDAI_0C05090 [Naumovozyma dairenensis CBS 421]|uniref:Uncharacterized protein n=1 Tax=Naumovozyma dairenensis (strain ATCC 10597 / BCRC 20456 / CBS 421 / NBRC 0211 / NRRL Y-12639) TaxID=1071378 RepID=G0W8Q7_NAUDC|nr:hypothetical protein NDAI_0C05090 [Naumovozyma dairenensis CBS 421]CCD24168.1 hypothetical protein NDAI_0C05090 [Naumovozyma dairenensis CBS 421]